MATEILIAGAGPTGLAMALWLAKSGVRFRIVDKTPRPSDESRALVVHARTLELYAQAGFADEAIAHGLEFSAANLWAAGERVARVGLGDIGADLSPYPYMLILAQDRHERLLVERLATLGVQVERETEVVDVEQGEGSIVARLRRGDGSEERCECAWLAGCDGAHSTVRRVLDVGFPGGTYARLFYVADTEARGPVMNHELHVALDAADLLAVFPMQGDARARLIGTVKRGGTDTTFDPGDARPGQAAKAAAEPIAWHDVSDRIIARLHMDVERVNWFSTYHVHHRVASHFRRGRAFLLGDAAHIHSPVGGQGMNTGIGDACNLGWKLAGVVRSRIDARVLDTYAQERIAFARRLVATTDRAFEIATSDGSIARFVRMKVIPRVLPRLLASAAVRSFMFRTLSQTAIEYRSSTLSSGAAGSVRAGDRLPWIELADAPNGCADNFAPLASRDWQLHVYGEPGHGVTAACRQRNIPLHAFPWRAAMQGAGFARDACYLVRPDAYVALAQAHGNDVGALKRYLDDWRIVVRA